MYDFKEFSYEDLLTLQCDLDVEIERRKRVNLYQEYPDYISKIKDLKGCLEKLAGDGVALNIEGNDIYIRIEYPAGFSLNFDTLDSSPYFDLEAYNKDCFEQLYLENNQSGEEIENFYIPLWTSFLFSEDESLLKDSPDDVVDYDNVVFVLRVDSIDYIFTKDL